MQSTEHKQGRVERKGNTESKEGSRIWAVNTEPDAELKPRNHEIMMWAEVCCLTDWATQAPLKRYFLDSQEHLTTDY